MTQYGCLGLWAATRAGIDVPNEVWDRVMEWHFKLKLPDGGFAYTPGTTLGLGKGQSTLNMTSAAIGSMSIAALHLFPEQMENSLQLAQQSLTRASCSDKSRVNWAQIRSYSKKGRAPMAECESAQEVRFDEQNRVVRIVRDPHLPNTRSGRIGRSSGLTGHFETYTVHGPEMYLLLPGTNGGINWCSTAWRARLVPRMCRLPTRTPVE